MFALAQEGELFLLFLAAGKEQAFQLSLFFRKGFARLPLRVVHVRGGVDGGIAFPVKAGVEIFCLAADAFHGRENFVGKHEIVDTL